MHGQRAAGHAGREEPLVEGAGGSCKALGAAGAHHQQPLHHRNIMPEPAERQLAHTKDEGHTGAILDGVDVPDLLQIVAVDALVTLEAPVLHTPLSHQFL
jgi:hypothetical protein